MSPKVVGDGAGVDPEEDIGIIHRKPFDGFIEEREGEEVDGTVESALIVRHASQKESLTMGKGQRVRRGE